MKTETRQKIRDTLRVIGENITKNPEKAMNAAIYGGLAYLGYQKLPNVLIEGLPLSPLTKLLWGPIGFRLATTPGMGEGFALKVGFIGVEMPANSQTVGLAMLAYLGLHTMPWDELNENFYGTTSKVQQATDAYKVTIQTYGMVMTDLERNNVDGLYQTIQDELNRGFFGNENVLLAIAGLLGYIEMMKPTWEDRLHGLE